MELSFAKLHGLGNDFVFIDDRDRALSLTDAQVSYLCDRHFGIGADGVMTLSRSAGTDCAMRYFNADGSEGEMCGNGARCFALFAEHLGIGGEGKRFTAADGLHTARILRTEGTGGLVELGMTEVAEIRRGDGWWFLNTGVPHYVEFVGDLDTADVCGRGRAIRRDTARFPQGTNVNFVRILRDGAIAVRTYERGVEAETLACGTGATAAAIVTNFACQPAVLRYDVAVPGGTLSVRFSREAATEHYSDIRLTGPARRVFAGEFGTEDF